MLRLILFALLALLPCVAEDLYIGQSSAGTGDGSNCSNQLPYTFFNSSGNWGAGAGKISAGDTVHICSIVTGGLNTTLLTFQGSGSAGNPVTLLFETDADLTSPAWGTGGAIACTGQNYITIDGGTNGKIENTANGTLLANQVDSRAVNSVGCSNLTVQHLTVSNFYLREEDNTTDATDADCIAADSSDNVLFTHNTVDHCRIGLAFTNSAVSTTHSNFEASFNTLTFVEHGMTIAAGSTGAIISGVSIHDNDLGGGAYLWDSGSPNIWHHDPIHMFSQASGSSVNSVQIYNNYFHGVWSRDSGYGGTHITAEIFLEQLGSGTTIFNNIFDLTQGTVLNQPANGDVFCKGSGSDNCRVYNNTFVDVSDFSEGFQCSSNSGHDVRNNIFYNTDGFYAPSGCTIAASDNNDFYLTTTWTNNGSSFNSLSGWQTASGLDGNSIAASPLLNLTSYLLGAGSPAIAMAANLTSLSISHLGTDKSGVSRPSSGPWDAGAYQAVPASTSSFYSGTLKGFRK